MSHIHSLLSRMDSLLDSMERAGDARRYFLGVYRRTTQAVAGELAAGGFLDADWVERWDVVFADLYLRAVDAWDRGESPAEPWRVAFGAGRDGQLPPLRHVLLGMNAHINYDLPLALLDVIDDAGFADPALVARRHRDHVHIDAVLVRRVRAEDEAASTASRRPDRLLGRIKRLLERRATQRFLREARAKVWANTRLMAAARAAGDLEELERLRDELACRSASRLQQLTLAREVLLQLAVRGFGVLLPPRPLPED